MNKIEELEPCKRSMEDRVYDWFCIVYIACLLAFLGFAIGFPVGGLK